MLIAACVLAVAAIALYADRQSTWARAERATHNLMLALQSDIARTLGVYDLSMQGVIDGLDLPGLQGFTPRIRHTLLFDRAATADFLGSMLVLDRTGKVIEDSGAVPPRAGNFSDRDYFKVHESDAHAGLFLSRPYTSRLRNGDESFALSRRVNAGEEQFEGIVLGAVRLEFFRNRFSQLDVGRDGTLSVLRSDGILMVRKPFNPQDVGRDVRNANVMQSLRRADTGLFVARADIDGIERLYAFGHVPGFPLIVTVALSKEEILQPWWRKTAILAPITMLLCAGIVWLTFLFDGELGRRRAAEAELAKLARTDALTSVANRRVFDEALQREWRAALREGQPLSLLFIDVDHFKGYNDAYGHPEGDRFLKKLADTVSRHIRRPRDLVARYGGEEFTVLLPGTAAGAARLVAETIRQAVAAMHVEHRANAGGVATISIGLASMTPRADQTPGMLVTRADAALYRAKGLGRNRTESA